MDKKLNCTAPRLFVPDNPGYKPAPSSHNWHLVLIWWVGMIWLSRKQKCIV
jgi:hypothetical protein